MYYYRQTVMLILLVFLLVCGKPVAAQDEPVIHIVRRGETLYRIANNYGVSVQAIATANGIPDPGRIHIGQHLVIPDGPAPTGLAKSISSGAAIFALESEDVNALWPLNLGVISGVSSKMREVYLHGQALGNNSRAFSKIGDCNSEPPFFLYYFDDGQYKLGPYAHLQPAVEHFAGSFSRESVTVWTGNHTWAVLDSMWADPAYCKSGETPIACEFRLHRPSVVLVRLGTNDVGRPELFADSLRQIVEFSIAKGVIPILGTKADRYEGSDANNQVIRQIAAEYEVPLWDFGRVADTLPGRGLRRDGVHMTWAKLDFSDEQAFQKGHSVHNLTALMALEAVWRAAMD